LVNPKATTTDYELALTVVNNWRSSHSYPLNTLQMSLRKRAWQYEGDATVAQRIKRLPSIRHKLDRFPGIALASMQDIGGCRAVFTSVAHVEALVSYYEHESRMKHALLKKNQYVEAPKTSGYRGVHLIYKYYSDKQRTWNGLRIELQIRSRLQHAWATAVETVGLFTRQALKSSQGEKDWLRFFALMSSVLAAEEGTPTVPGTPADKDDLLNELRAQAIKLDVIARLRAFNDALNVTEQVGQRVERRGKWLFLLTLSFDDPSQPQLSVRAYTDPLVATQAYEAVERATADDPAQDVVLVQSGDLTSLRRAYPNYFLDTNAFVESV
jgi:ppGpp synthetase/RelA/SpoT-type nucleotidyltranferase